jgi:hypothetical protein
MVYFFTGSVSLFYLLPFILFGSDSIITIPGNLDDFTAWMKIFRENGLFFKFDIPVKIFEKISGLRYPVNYSFQSLVYSLFDDFTAYTLLYCFSMFLALGSMYLLLRKTLRLSHELSLLVSMCYMILPVAPAGALSFHGTLPFIVYFFFLLAKVRNKNFRWKTCLLLFFPFFSNFIQLGILLCAIWFFALVIVTIRDKNINPNLLWGVVFLCIGYAVVELRLFYMLVALKAAPNWNSLIQPAEVVAVGGLGEFFISFIEYWTAGYYHAASMQKKLIFPIVFFTGVFLVVKTHAHINRGRLIDEVKEIYKNFDRETKIFLLLELVIFCFSFIAALCGSVIGQVWIFSRVLWYIIFALCIYIVIREIKKLTFVFSGRDSCRSFVLPEFVVFLIMFFFVLFQTGYTVSQKVYYSDARNTWAHMFHVALNIDDSPADYISYDEYFAEYFFDEIKRDIFYTDEKVAALGYSSSVLLYNGFDCIATYNPVDPSRNKYMEPAMLDTDVFVNYILSRAEIVNSDNLGLDLIKKYEDDKGIYIIYLYKSRSNI